MATTAEKCFACDRPIRGKAEPRVARTIDGQTVYVGGDCFRKIRQAAAVGYQPPKGGPRLFELPSGA